MTDSIIDAYTSMGFDMDRLAKKNKLLTAQLEEANRRLKRINNNITPFSESVFCEDLEEGHREGYWFDEWITKEQIIDTQPVPEDWKPEGFDDEN